VALAKKKKERKMEEEK